MSGTPSHPDSASAQRLPVAARPIVKWAGGKTRLLDALARHCPSAFGRYYEPFAGGAALFFHLSPESAVLSDLNADLIGVYRCVAHNVDAVIEHLREHRAAHCTDHYYATRDRWNAREATDTDLQRAAMFLYLNKTCYNGLWRVNASGAFNVPMGRYRNPQVFDAAVLRAAATRLQKVELRVGDYSTAVEDAGPGDLVYLDPPYVPLSKTANFASYTARGFDGDEQRRLAAVARSLVARGCAVVVSNHDTPDIRDLYEGFAIRTVVHGRAINSKPDRRGAVRELILSTPGPVTETGGRHVGR